jgi:hypothetical protein
MVAELTLTPPCLDGCYPKEENLNHSGGVSAVLFWTFPCERRRTRAPMITRTIMMEVAGTGSNSSVSHLLGVISQDSFHATGDYSSNGAVWQDVRKYVRTR